MTTELFLKDIKGDFEKHCYKDTLFSIRYKAKMSLEWFKIILEVLVSTIWEDNKTRNKYCGMKKAKSLLLTANDCLAEIPRKKTGTL